MRLFPALALLLAMSTLAVADDPIRVPSEVKGNVNQFIVIRGETTGKLLRWRTFDPGLQTVDSALLGDPKTTIVIGTRPGRYTLWVWTAVDGVPTDLYPVSVIIGDPAPTPVPPPAPPPPNPNPPSPAPVDPLRVKLKTLFDGDVSPRKREQLADLKSMYELAAKSTGKPSLVTVMDLRDDIRVASGLLAPDALVGIRQALRDELANTLGTDPDARLDDDRRRRALELFLRIAAILLELLK